MTARKPILTILQRDSEHRDASDPGVTAAVHAALGPVQVFPHDKTVLDLFHDQVIDGADRPALHYRDVTVSYAELNHVADTTAARLIDHGVSPGSLVPVLITEGPRFPAAMIAVMKTGAAFVPLDHAWPLERLRVIAAELRPTAILTTTVGASAVSELGLADRAVPMARIWPSAAPIPPATGELAATGRPQPLDLIYGFYTSGSTGTPKCALNRHRGLVNRLTAMSRRFGDGGDHVALQNSRSTFDSSMWQVFWPLISGGQVVLPHRDGILDLEQTVRTIGRYGVTITDFVPSVLAAFVALLELRPDLLEAASCLRRMLIGGEPANPTVVHRLRRLLPDLQVTNTYGPTECSIGSVFYDVGEADAGRIPLGRAIDNTAAIVLDEDRRPVPVGTIGEIYLGGECIGAGYLDDEKRTAIAFVPNPVPEIPGDLLYRTGDLAKVDEAGQLHYLGRRDDQVKVGGVRIELGDVAAALAAHPLVGDALALVLDVHGDATLVCCVTPRDRDNPPRVVDLRRHAQTCLPSELVPSRIIVHDALPVSRNGKADRKVLATMLAEEIAGPAEEPPAGPMEELIAAAWAEVLGLSQVSVATTFQEYGGTSLTAYRLAVAISSRLGQPVSPRDLLTGPTVREQAARLTAGAPDERAELETMVNDLAWLPPRVVLLTGGTGFVGAHLLADLLRLSAAKLFCLVRARDARHGAERLTATLQHYHLTAASALFSMALNTGRVKVIVGDLGQERLGLSDTQFAALAATTTDVVHAGAVINFLGSYADHRSANVVAVQELIKFAGLTHACRLHALSTLSIFPLSGWGTMPMINEDQTPDPDRVAVDGYSRSKYVAERLLQNARADGVSSVVYRLGEVWPHRELGVPNPRSVAHLLLYACARTASVFDTDAAVDLTPVDAVSRFVVRCTTGEAAPPDGTVHVLWPRTLRLADVFAELANRGRVDRVSYAEFRRRLDLLAEPPESDEHLMRLRLVLPPATAPGAPPEFRDLFTPCGMYFNADRFGQHAAGASAPAADPVAALDRYLDDLATLSRAARPRPPATTTAPAQRIPAESRSSAR